MESHLIVLTPLTLTFNPKISRGLLLKQTNRPIKHEVTAMRGHKKKGKNEFDVSTFVALKGNASLRISLSYFNEINLQITELKVFLKSANK